MVPVKVSPVCEAALESEDWRRIGIGVPSGSFVVDGIRVRLGEIPEERGSRSKGSFCALAFAELSAGGRPHPHKMPSNIETIMTAGRAWLHMSLRIPIDKGLPQSRPEWLPQSGRDGMRKY